MSKNWKITGYVATLIIVLAFPAYIIKAVYLDDFGRESSGSATMEYVGSKKCVECHKPEYDLWLRSDHYFAMDTADEQSVLGDFNDVTLMRGGITHKFYRKDDRFFVYTDGSDGEMTEYEVKYTFGAWPLQQYLVEFPGGRLQTLALTWDTLSKQWYHMADAVYEGQDIDHTDWLHWTNQAQNWNGMCADCHSTNLVKGYDMKTDSYHTTWSEISVGCETCHGPSSGHLEWAALPPMARPQNTNTGLVVKTSGIDNRQYVDLCARCHSRRATLGDFNSDYQELLDHIVPALAIEPNYFPDGQILEEDYVYGSFVQSKMYMNDVTCSDCHNAHSGKLLFQGNDLCLQCHRADLYDTYDHHFHKNAGEDGQPVVSQFGDTYRVGDGALCINCHMPGRYYMGVDYRRDHSFRIPRPDLSEKLGIPNACTYCHADKSNRWATDYLHQWYGKSLNSNFGTQVALGLEDPENGADRLAEIVADDLFPPHVRATAISALSYRYDTAFHNLLHRAFSDLEPEIRNTALDHFNLMESKDMEALLPLLNDPVKAVRIAAAFKLSSLSFEEIPKHSRNSLDSALAEYKRAMEYSADFATSRHNLGILYANLGDMPRAIDNYLEAIRIDDQFYPAKINLAIAFNSTGQNDKAEILFRDVLKNHPEVPGVNYSFGLLLAEMEKYDEALIYLGKAVAEQPNNPRVYLNYGQMLDFLGQPEEAEKALLDAVALQPLDAELNIRLIEFYMKHEQYREARALTLEYQKNNPEDESAQQLLNFIDSKLPQ